MVERSPGSVRVETLFIQFDRPVVVGQRVLRLFFVMPGQPLPMEGGGRSGIEFERFGIVRPCLFVLTLLDVLSTALEEEDGGFP